MLKCWKWEWLELKVLLGKPHTHSAGKRFFLPLFWSETTYKWHTKVHVWMYLRSLHMSLLAQLPGWEFFFFCSYSTQRQWKWVRLLWAIWLSFKQTLEQLAFHLSNKYVQWPLCLSTLSEAVFSLGSNLAKHLWLKMICPGNWAGVFTHVYRKDFELGPYLVGKPGSW